MFSVFCVESVNGMDAYFLRFVYGFLNASYLWASLVVGGLIVGLLVLSCAGFLCFGQAVIPACGK